MLSVMVSLTLSVFAGLTLSVMVSLTLSVLQQLMHVWTDPSVYPLNSGCIFLFDTSTFFLHP